MEEANSINIELDNDYYLKIGEENILYETVDINDLAKTKFTKNQEILLKIDFSKIDEKEYKKVLKKLLALKNSRKKLKFGKKENSKILLGYIVNYEKENENQANFIAGINAIFFNTKYERYNYIYTTVCDYLDDVFYGKNVCDFVNDKCGEKRCTSSLIGCCRHYKHKILGPILPHDFVPCENLQEDGRCGIRCLGCKLFTCDYLEAKGIKFRIKDILLLDTFFNPIQKYILKYMVYTPQEKVIKAVMHF